MNCHQDQVPLQGDSRRPHVPHVERGQVGMGVGTMACTTCHNQSGNNDTSGTPGAAGWMLAPAEMKWEGLSVAQLCEQMKDPARNGHRDGAKLIEHMHSDLVKWGWAPGGNRELPPLSFDQFLKEFTRWVDSGLSCPAS